jgi:LuxR family maltose regulon positive regulatory protein
MTPMSESLMDLAARVKELEEADQFVGKRMRDPLSDCEMRVLRYLPTNLTAAEIVGELYVSVHTVKTHIRHIYAKLDTHRRTETVERARSLGLLAASSIW